MMDAVVMDTEKLTREEWDEIGRRLREPFDPADVDFRVQGKASEQTGKAQVVAYIDARAVMDRLDAVVGTGNWSFDWQPLVMDKGEVMVAKGIITIHGVSKADAGSASNFEQSLGACSHCFKRAAVHWGIGRYLYNLPMAWVAVERGGRIPDPVLRDLRAKLPRPGQQQGAAANRQGNGGGGERNGLLPPAAHVAPVTHEPPTAAALAAHLEERPKAPAPAATPPAPASAKLAAPPDEDGPMGANLKRYYVQTLGKSGSDWGKLWNESKGPDQLTKIRAACEALYEQRTTAHDGDHDSGEGEQQSTIVYGSMDKPYGRAPRDMIERLRALAAELHEAEPSDDITWNMAYALTRDFSGRLQRKNGTEVPAEDRAEQRLIEENRAAVHAVR